MRLDARLAQLTAKALLRMFVGNPGNPLDNPILP